MPRGAAVWVDAASELKQCTRCGEIKHAELFDKGMAALGRDSRCKKCRKEIKAVSRAANPVSIEKQREYKQRYHDKHPERIRDKYRKQALRKKFGITVEEYDRLHEQQKGLCGICGCPETSRRPDSDGQRRLAVDHCRETGKVRGLLCSRCNTAIGLLLHSQDRLTAALVYLMKAAA